MSARDLLTLASTHPMNRQSMLLSAFTLLHASAKTNMRDDHQAQTLAKGSCACIDAKVQAPRRKHVQKMLRGEATFPERSHIYCRSTPRNPPQGRCAIQRSCRSHCVPPAPIARPGQRSRHLGDFQSLLASTSLLPVSAMHRCQLKSLGMVLCNRFQAQVSSSSGTKEALLNVPLKLIMPKNGYMLNN